MNINSSKVRDFNTNYQFVLKAMRHIGADPTELIEANGNGPDTD
jgi:hypothetical protein